MAWITITEAHVLTVVNSVELEAIRDAALAALQADPATESISQVTDLVRGYVGVKNTLGATGIPQKLLPTALDIIAYRIPNRVGRQLPASKLLLYQDAIKLLESVALGKFDIEEPVTESTEVSSNPSPSIIFNTMTFSRTLQNGI
jgi:phage gp36-like protein